VDHAKQAVRTAQKGIWLSFVEISCVQIRRVLSLRAVPVDPVIALHSETAASPLVLIVEDDFGTRAMYKEYLTHAGFRTADAHNGHQALAKARELRPDAILTDLAVPGMDGFEFCRALKESSPRLEIPILAVTGHSEYLDQPDRFRQAGIDQVLVKPCAPDLILRELRRLLQGAPASSVGRR
jgi:two-component system cell cycle response regulator DivK